MLTKVSLSRLIQKTVRKVLAENSGAVSDSDLDDATELLMMVSGRIMSAQNTAVPSEIIAQAVHHIELADGILASAGLKADADISENISPRRRKR